MRHGLYVPVKVAHQPHRCLCSDSIPSTCTLKYKLVSCAGLISVSVFHLSSRFVTGLLDGAPRLVPKLRTDFSNTCDAVVVAF